MYVSVYVSVVRVCPTLPLAPRVIRGSQYSNLNRNQLIIEIYLRQERVQIKIFVAVFSLTAKDLAKEEFSAF